MGNFDGWKVLQLTYESICNEAASNDCIHFTPKLTRFTPVDHSKLRDLI